MDAETDGGEPAGPGSLQGVPWFAACTDEQLREIARIAERLHIQSGEVILREGRLGRELFVILEGTVTVTRAGRVVNIRAPATTSASWQPSRRCHEVPRSRRRPISRSSSWGHGSSRR